MRALSGVNRVVGNVFAWLALAIVLVCFTVVVQRYAFSTTQVWMQDLYVWLNGAMFTAVAGFALLRDDHVRVDIFYRPATLRTKALIDMIGVVIFIVPYCWVIYSYGMPYVQRSWRLYEASPNVGGMPGFFVLKSFILLFGLLILLQGIAMIARSVLILGGREDLVPENLRYGHGKE
ncbi:C4-dicarboxylate ABC transporter substrate-binding protein [Salinarimonas ramus]|uniref:TRAP transporter small permease protein n=2 Tax=Salinarimonas ramus TaxID=690164 RepID=A0A917V994_9HYPH|nr:C4-dicarboxylate ABC transporter substrate-binding protein [Salinarimonas ramus]